MSKKQSAAKTDYRTLIFDKWDSLSNKDKTALTILSLFLILFLGGYGGYMIKEMVDSKQESYQTEINDYFWLRGQASNIDPTLNSEQTETIEQQLNRELAQSNAKNVQVIMTQDSVQLTFEHDNQAVVNNILSSIINSGYYLNQLSMTQNPDSKLIQVQAQVS